MNRWQKNLQTCVTAPDELSPLFNLDTEDIAQVVKRYPMRITRYYLGLVERPGDASGANVYRTPLNLRIKPRWKTPSMKNCSARYPD